jgi:hypothetical protein
MYGAKMDAMIHARDVNCPASFPPHRPDDSIVAVNELDRRPSFLNACALTRRQSRAYQLSSAIQGG